MKAIRYLGGLAAAAALALSSMGGVAQAQTNFPFSTGIQVQNLSTSTANIRVDFYTGTSGTSTANFTAAINPNKSVTYATLPSAVPAGFDGSAVISSDQRVAATVNIVSPDLGAFANAGSLGGATYAGVTSGAPSVFLPLLFKGYFNFNTFVAVQNVGSTNTDITITYAAAGSPKQTVANVAPGASARFDQAAFATLPAGFVGAATITSTASDVAAVVTQVGPSTVLSYNGFTNATATKPVFPLVNANNFGFITGIALQNAGSQATEVTIRYTPSVGANGQPQGTACDETLTIQPGASANFAVDAFARGITGETCANGATFVGSGAVTVNSTNQPLVAIVNQLNSATRKGGAYAAFDPTVSTNTVVYPLIQDRVSGFFTGTAVYNAGTVPTTVQCTFTGNTTATNPPSAVPDVQRTSPTLQPGETYSLVQSGIIANGFTGSGTCVAQATGAKIIGTANQLNVTRPSDTFFVYEGINN